MKDVVWDFIEEPHLLIGEVQEEGRQFFMSIIYALAKVGLLIFVIRKLKFILLENPVFHGRVFTSKGRI